MEMIASYINILNQLDILRNTVTGDDLQWVNMTFNSTFQEYNTIRATNPQVTITVGQMPASQEAAPSQPAFEAAPAPQSQVSQPALQPQPLFPMSLPANPTQANPVPLAMNPPVEAHSAFSTSPARNVATEVPASTAGTESAAAPGSDFLTMVSSELHEFDAKYKVKESLKESFDRGVANVKAWFAEKSLKDRMSDGLHDTEQWLRDNMTKDKVASGFRSASFVVIRGAVRISAGISDGLSRLLARMEAPENADGNNNRNNNPNAALLLDPADCLESPDTTAAALHGENGETVETMETGKQVGNEVSGAPSLPLNPIPMNPSVPINQPMNQPMNQFMNASVPMNQPMNQPINQPINQPVNPSVPMNQPVNQPVNQPANLSMAMNQPVNPSVPVNQQANSSVPMNASVPTGQAVNQPMESSMNVN